jgi:hypothetical protein
MGKVCFAACRVKADVKKVPVVYTEEVLLLKA